MAGLAGTPSKTTQPAAVPATRQGATQSPRQAGGAATQSTRPVAGAAALSTQPEAQTESPFAQPAGPIEVDVRFFFYLFFFYLSIYPIPLHSSIHSFIIHSFFFFLFTFFLPAFPLKPLHVCEERRRREREDRGIGRVKLLFISTVFPQVSIF